MAVTKNNRPRAADFRPDRRHRSGRQTIIPDRRVERGARGQRDRLIDTRAHRRRDVRRSKCSLRHQTACISRA